MNEYQIKVTVRNNLILKAIEQAGFKTVADCERAAEVHQGKFNALIAMRERPITTDGEFSFNAKRLMEILGAAPCELWTDEQLYLKLDRNTSKKEVSREDIHHFIEHQTSMFVLPDPEHQIVQNEIHDLIDRTLKTLTKREEQVLKLRFEDDQTLEQVAQVFGVTRERIRQVEAKALRKMRHPTRAYQLKQCYETQG